MGTGPVTDHRTRGTQRHNMKVVFLLVLAPLLCWGNSPLVCVSKQGNECQFPFTYRGRTFNQCTTYLSRNGAPWCRTTNGRLQDCEGYCPGAGGGGSVDGNCFDDETGGLREDGESWEKDCNTCTCNGGNVACTLIGCRTKPPGPCECNNPPFSGDTCSQNPPFCYVDCNSDCYDKEQSGGNCFSTFACNPFVPNSPSGR